MAHAGDRNSDLSQIAVNANNIPTDSVDCGIRVFGCCSGPFCQKYARLRTFVLVLAGAGILQGACETYFRISAKQAALEYGYNPLVVDWLLVSSGLFQAVFALVFAHWANKMHPINWLSGVIMLQAATCIIAIIPSITSFSDGVSMTSPAAEASLCATTISTMQKTVLSPEQTKVGTLVLLFVLQFALGFGSLAYYTIGVSYLDDNSLSIDSPAVIGTALAARVFGLEVGASLTLTVGRTSIGWWLGWAILGPLVFISGIVLALFPKRLPKTVIHQAAQRIIEETRSRQFGSQFSTYIDDTAFGPTVKRIFKNKLLMFNLTGIMFIQAAYINYLLQEESYVQSRFYLPYSEEDGLTQEWNARFVSYFLKPPVAAIAILVGGLVIAKLKLSGRKIASINIGLGVKLFLVYIAFIFIKCDVGPIAGITAGKIQQPYCSRQCICEPIAFTPVCPENSTVTYFSPCYAGCSKLTTINSVQLYEGCSCGLGYDAYAMHNVRASPGACSAAICSNALLTFEVLSIASAALLGMMAIGKIMITLRSVLPQDKALALAMEVMFVGLFTYVPAHLGYNVVTRTTCLYWAPNYSRCLLRETPKHGNILNILSAALVLMGILFDVLVFIYVKGINLYNCKVTDSNYTPALYAPIHNEELELHHAAPSVLNAQGGSPATTITNASSLQQNKQTAPTETPLNFEPQIASKIDHRNGVPVFRNPSSVTTSSAGESSIEPSSASGVTYAQVVFPPDKRKPDDGTTSPKRMAVRADVPVQHLSSQDVRTQLSNLKSFNAPSQPQTPKPTEITPLTLTTTTVPKETDLDSMRPQSPETDF